MSAHMAEFLSLRDIATRLGVAVRTVRRHIVQRQECPWVRVGRRVLVRREDFETWLQKDQQAAQARPTEAYRRTGF